MTGETISQTKEVRFAVVMYGGVSLAIYINGVAQELYNLVRATATQTDDNNRKRYLFEAEKLGGAGKVYRKLGELLDSRFVVDILSGTSAGGINAVFLAKSLANGESFEQLKQLWIEEGDIDLLINDRKSGLADQGLKASAQPASLLNSQRMYYKLLYALDNMKPELPESGQGRSPYVDELDLFVTATDVRGQVQDRMLTSGRAKEYRYKNVFRFHYATTDAAGGSEHINDFDQANSPFLAFAARCTSAFPFAFEPMRLADVETVLTATDFRNKYQYQPGRWKNFYKDYLIETSAGPDTASTAIWSDFERRAFGDGGYLDNKPFSYATDTLLRRRADLPVDRKLIYIEPAPEHIREQDKEGYPNALQNVAAALLTLPRYETIFEDLQLITERNHTIERVGSILQQIRHASRATLKKDREEWQLDGVDWARKYLDKQMLDWYGPGYAVYHQLRVASLLDDLGSGLARAIGWEETGEQAWNFRHRTLEGWRSAYYSIDPAEANERRSENDLLFRLDISWRLRRLQFTKRVIDELIYGLSDIAPGGSEASGITARTHAGQLVADSGGKLEDWPFSGDAGERETYRMMLLLAKAGFNEAYKELRAGGRGLRKRNILASSGAGKDSAGGMDPGDDLEAANNRAYVEQLRALKEAIDTEAGEEAVYACMENLSLALAAREAKPQPPAVKGAVRSLISANAAMIRQFFEAKDTLPENMEQETEKIARAVGRSPSDLKAILERVRSCLRYYYDNFEYFDMQTLPLTFGTEIGESDVVEIIRISPEDATSITKDPAKLAGTQLGNFGAFFVREWRENDILWGRLDGAECLIKALLPGEEHAKTREGLIEEAHEAILQEYYLDLDWKKFSKSLRSDQPQQLEQLKTELETLKGGIASTMDSAGGALARFKAEHRVDREFPPDTLLQISARASRVTGKVLTGITDRSPESLSKFTALVAQLGAAFNGLVQLALPNGFLNMVFNSLVWLLYFIAVILLLAGGVFNVPGMTTVGLVTLGATLVTHLGILYLQAFLKRKLRTLRFARWLIQALVLLLAAGLVFLAYMGLANLGWAPQPGGRVIEWLRSFRN